MKEPEDRDEDERDDYQDEDTRRCIVCETLIHSGLTCGGCEQENSRAPKTPDNPPLACGESD